MILLKGAMKSWCVYFHTSNRIKFYWCFYCRLFFYLPHHYTWWVLLSVSIKKSKAEDPNYFAFWIMNKNVSFYQLENGERNTFSKWRQRARNKSHEKWRKNIATWSESIFFVLVSPHSVIFHFLELCPEHIHIKLKNEREIHHAGLE